MILLVIDKSVRIHEEILGNQSCFSIKIKKGSIVTIVFLYFHRLEEFSFHSFALLRVNNKVMIYQSDIKNSSFSRARPWHFYLWIYDTKIKYIIKYLGGHKSNKRCHNIHCFNIISYAINYAYFLCKFNRWLYLLKKLI